MSGAGNPRDLASFIENVALASAVAASAALVAWVLWYAGYGYDFSDEGHYLNWIANPWVNQTSVTQFSFIYHPLYQLLGGDIALLRRVSLLLTLGLGWLLCHLLLEKLVAAQAVPGRRRCLPRLATSAILSTCTLACLHFFWLPTPSYDSLALQSLLLAGTGLVLADTGKSRQSLLGWFLIGISGWLAFMAKPTTAMALGAAIGLYLVLSGRFRWRMLVITLATAASLGLASAWAIDGNIAGFVRRLALGADDARLLQGRHTLGEALRWDTFQLTGAEKGTLACATVLVFFATCLSLSPNRARRTGGAAVAFIPSLVCLWIVLLGGTPQLGLGRFHGVQFWAVPFGALLAVGAMAAKGKLPRPVARDQWALALCFATFPHIYAFGTNENYWMSGSRAAVFWVLAGVVLLAALHRDEMDWRIFLPTAAGAQLCTTVLLFVSMEYPYRQTQPLRLNTDLVQFAGTGSKLLVSRGFADYVAKLQLLAATAGFKAGDPMLDLTGRYPGALYALGAQSVGRSWMIGGYPGSEALAIANLDRVSPAELKSAWILTEPDGPRKLPTDILKRYGIDVAHDFHEVGELNSPRGSYPDRYKQHLLKPAAR